MKTAKEQAIVSISRLPSDVTWQDIVYCLYVRRKMEEGIKARTSVVFFPMMK